MNDVVAVAGTALLLSFVLCCIGSGVLQVFAWSRHSRDDVPASLRALWNPEPYFDEIGLRQIHVARRLLAVGAAAYLTYGFLLLASAAR
jgi:hypothetical protein